MRIIDSDNYQVAGIETFVFPGGEPHVKIPDLDEETILFLKLRNWLDVGYAALICNAISWQMDEKRKRAGVNNHKYIFIPYFPGGRQDRTDGYSPVTVNLMEDIFGWTHNQGSSMHVFDPHSYHTPENYLYTSDFPNFFIPSKEITGVIVPDEGAFERCVFFRDAFCPNASLVQCKKSREFKTGNIVGYEMEALPAIGHYIIVDDICDGGRTFNLLAESFKLDKFGAESTLEMYVSHGIFSKGLDNIDPKIEKITTTDSWCQLPNSERLQIINLLPFFEELINKEKEEEIAD